MGSKWYRYSFVQCEASSFTKDGDWLILRGRNGETEACIIFEMTKEIILNAKRSKKWFPLEDGEFQVCHYEDRELDFCEWVKIKSFKEKNND